MPRVILHLGTYKTGTSSIQNDLQSNRAALLSRGVLYPQTGLTKNSELGYRHTPLVHKFTSRGEAELPAALFREIRETGCETVILSSEAWSAPRSFSHLNHCMARFRDEGIEEVSAVLFLRNIADYRVSLYREFTCNQRSKRTYEGYVKHGHGIFDYLLLVRFYRTLFGDRLIVRMFGRDDSLKTFRDALGADIFDGIPVTADRANTKSVDALDVEIIRCLNVADRPQADIPEQREQIREKLGMTDPAYTERHAADHPVYPKSYMTELAELSGLSADDVSALLADKPITGRPVTEATPAIEALIRPGRTSLMRGIFG